MMTKYFLVGDEPFVSQRRLDPGHTTIIRARQASGYLMMSMDEAPMEMSYLYKSDGNGNDENSWGHLFLEWADSSRKQWWGKWLIGSYSLSHYSAREEISEEECSRIIGEYTGVIPLVVCELERWDLI